MQSKLANFLKKFSFQLLLMPLWGEGGGCLPKGSGHAPRQIFKSRLKSELFRCYFYLLHRTKRLSKFADFWKKYATVGRGGFFRGVRGACPPWKILKSSLKSLQSGAIFGLFLLNVLEQKGHLKLLIS